MTEPLTWGVAANVSRDVVVRQAAGTKRPGTRHFGPGAKVWVLPIMWGDGGEKRYVVGTHRQTGGRSLIRLVLTTEYLVNLRVKPVHSPAIYAAMGQPWPDAEPEGTVDWWNTAHGMWRSGWLTAHAWLDGNDRVTRTQFG